MTGFTRGHMGRSATHTAIFLFLLAVLCSLPVLAFGAEASQSPPASSQEPSAEALETAARQKDVELGAAEREREEELATPAAEAERERSQTAYAQVDASEASELLTDKFGQSIARLNEDPGRLLTDLEVEKMLGPNAARVSSPETGREIVEASSPLVSSIGGEGSQPVDLELEQSGESFTPVNPTTPTELPASAEGSIEVGEGVRVQMPTVDDHEAVPIGEMSLFYPETEPTTDTMVSPVAGGVEIFDQLRSAESPEELTFQVELPEGAHLAAIPEGEGAEVVMKDGTTLEQVPAPTAVDAQGTTVPTTMTIEGDSLVVDVGLEAAQPAFPVLVDPLFIEEGTNFSAWGYDSNAAYGATQDASKLELWSQGSNYNYGAYTHAAYTYTSPGPTAWIEAATFNPIYFFPNSCGGNQPHGYIGLYNPGAGRWEKEARWEGLTRTGGDEWQTGWVGHPGTEWAIFGLGTDGSGTSLSCVHEFYLGGYSLQEKDTTPPLITSVTGVPLGHWFDPETVGEARMTAIDSGFGVFEISTGNGGAQPVGARPPGSGAGCTGVWGNRCPHEYTFQIKPAYERGKRPFHVWAKDAMGNEAASFDSETWVDVEAPAIELRGQFARATKEVGYSDQGAQNPAHENKLRLPTYELQINATDGSNAEQTKMQSGVQRVQVFLDGNEQPLPWGVQTCSAAESSCPLAGPFELKLPGLSTGIHTLNVVATDRVGLSRPRKIEFEYIPATGEGENQVLEHFPLPDGEGGPDGGEVSTQPEVAVNVMNGNLVFRQLDAEIASNDAALPIERTYNSELPQAQSGEFGTGWTLADAPEIEASGGGKATLVQGDGSLETAVTLPAQEGQTQFDPTTHDAIEKIPTGYAVADEGESTEPTADVSSSGVTSDLQGSAGANLDFERDGGELSRLVADDPGTAAGKAEEAVTESTRGYLFEGDIGGLVGSLSKPTATAVDKEGDIWVADTGNDRVEEFSPSGAYLSQFGSSGAEAGQFSEPNGIAVDPVGHVWVADGGHNRLQEFGTKGEFIRQVGTTGTGAGQFSSIRGIAVGATGNVYVADSHRIEEFDSEGGFLREWGKEGEGNGQFKNLQGITIDSSGNVRVLDYGAELGPDRVQAFSASGSYLATVKTPSYEVFQPHGLAIDGSGNIWISDQLAGHVFEFRPNGSPLRNVGTAGSAAGQLSEPGGISADAAGDIWVADTGNDRVEEFSPSGTYMARFGRRGANEGQITEPQGVAIASSGAVWVADTANDRIGRWTPSEPIKNVPVRAAPSATVETVDGLVQSVEGASTGTINYVHEETHLTQVQAPGSTTQYTYDAHGRLQRVDLPHGTHAEIHYDEVGRVTKLEISVEGGALETTSFEYLTSTGEPVTRETVVRRPAQPATRYSIGEEGSVLKWWYTATPPEIEEPTGSLWSQRGEVHSGPITLGDQDLILNAASPHGVESIELVANGGVVVAEQRCEKEHAWECLTLRLPYHTETGAWPPGILSLEVIAKDAIGGASSRRFWDDIPYTPSPNDAELEPPTYEDVLRFREDFGLDLDLKGNEEAIEERIFNLIDAWHEQSPEGVVARSSRARWGVPLRKTDVEEMEYRERYTAEAAKLIPVWAEVHAPEDYSGYYVDQRQGGIIHVGFASSGQNTLVTEMVGAMEGLAPGRIAPFEVRPSYSLPTLIDSANAVRSALATRSDLDEDLASIGIDAQMNKVKIQTANVAEMEAFLRAGFIRDQFSVEYGADRPSTEVETVTTREALAKPPKRLREANGRLFAGDALVGQIRSGVLDVATLGFGAVEAQKPKPNEEHPYLYFGLTAGHAFEIGPTVYRYARLKGKNVEFPIGHTERRSIETPVEGRETDAEAVVLHSGFIPPIWIWANSQAQLAIGEVGLPHVGEVVCHSGINGGYSCGTVTGFNEEHFKDVRYPTCVWEVSGLHTEPGDSGGPVWAVEGNQPLGLWTGGHRFFTPLLKSTLVEDHKTVCSNQGVLNAPGMGNIKISKNGRDPA